MKFKSNKLLNNRTYMHLKHVKCFFNLKDQITQLTNSHSQEHQEHTSKSIRDLISNQNFEPDKTCQKNIEKRWIHNSTWSIKLIQTKNSNQIQIMDFNRRKIYAILKLENEKHKKFSNDVDMIS